VTTAQDDQPDEYAGLLIRSNLPMGTLTQELKNALAEGQPRDRRGNSMSCRRNIRDSLLRERLMAGFPGFSERWPLCWP